MQATHHTMDIQMMRNSSAKRATFVVYFVSILEITIYIYVVDQDVVLLLSGTNSKVDNAFICAHL